uniref:tRNA (guanosine(18)-2'-O)-methyltransferase TARBP1 n=1 Tax=Clastoptera arizonana TaxID=38151 RepID=A0A1B6CIL5_9HEMI
MDSEMANTFTNKYEYTNSPTFPYQIHSILMDLIKMFKEDQSYFDTIYELLKLIQGNKSLFVHNSDSFIKTCEILIDNILLIMKKQTFKMNSSNSLFNILEICIDCCSVKKMYSLIDLAVTDLCFICSHNSDQDFVLINIYFLDVILKVLVQKLNMIDFDTKMINRLDCEEFYKLLISLAFSNNKVANTAIFLSIFPKIFHITKQPLLLQCVWNFISEKISGSKELSDQLFCLTSLANLFFSKRRDSLFLLDKEEFWTVIQLGLSDNDPILRKEALYLLKRSLDTIQENNIHLNGTIFCLRNSNSKKFKEIWELIFIIFEVLEEKQSHLVLPVLPSVLKIQDNSLDLHPSWILCLYKRILKHDSIQIMKWGVLNFLKIDIKLYTGVEGYEAAIIVFLKTINNLLLFSKSSNKMNEFSDVEIELNTWFKCILKQDDHRNLFLTQLLISLKNVHWSPIPLFYFLNSFSTIEGVNIWDNSCLSIIKDFVVESLSTETVYIRGAIQCSLLRILINLANREKISIDVLMNTLNVFRRSESLSRGTESWLAVVKWLRSFLLSKDIKLFFNSQLSKSNCEIQLSSESISRSLILLYDTGYISNQNNTHIFDSLNNYFDCLDGADVRLYSCIKMLDERVKLMTNILLEFCSRDVSFIQNEFHSSFYHFLQNIIISILPYITRRLKEIAEINDYFSIDIYLNFLESLKLSSLLENDIIPYVVQLQNKAFEICTRPNEEYVPAINQYFSLKILNWSSTIIYHSNLPKSVTENVQKICLHMINNYLLNNVSFKEKNDVNLTRNFQVLWGRVASESIQCRWSLLVKYYTISKLSSKDFLLMFKNKKDFILQVLHALEIGGHNIINYVLDLLKFVLSELLNSSQEECIELTNNLISTTWRACYDLRKMDLFWTSIQKWIEMYFQNEVISHLSNKTNILCYSEKILSEGESIAGLVGVFITHLRNQAIHQNLDSLNLMKAVFVSLLLFGTLQRKDQRIESETIDYIETLGGRFSINKLISDNHRQKKDSVIRIQALDIILRIIKKYPKMGQYFIHTLLDRERQMTSQKQRYYGDSLHHRVMNRILQNLLVLEAVIASDSSFEDKKCIVELHEWAFERLKGESQQPSIRYQLEWLFINTCLHNNALLNQFWEKLHRARLERLGSLCSFISISYHLAVVLQDEDFTDKCVQNLLPLCLGQNFNVHLYLQIVLEKLFKLSSAVSIRYKFLEIALSENVDHGNITRNTAKMKSDFFFSGFHPKNDLTFEAIFYDLPRLSNLTPEEWINISNLSNSISEEFPWFPSAVSLSNKDSELSKFEAASWIVKAKGTNEHSVDASGVQKKFVPWKGMIPHAEYVIDDTKPKKEGLIVVASLIEKIPNLGGLSRTCEIFAVENLVIGSLEYIKNKEFSVLSMSAEKHILITEVKPHNLVEYLPLMKKQGYTVVGAEQTAGSVSLGSFEFPKKTILLLGNEKEGIPVNLIHWLDICVEVPQHGLVRSLNVHVTGALFVWEYSKQHHK